MTDLLKTDNGIGGTLSEIKAVKTRGVIQMVIEAPIEHAEAIITAFGYPQPGKEKWVGVALLREPETPLKGRDTAPAKEDKPKLPWSERTPGSQAAYLCTLPEFQRWVTERLDPMSLPTHTEVGTIHSLYRHFAIDSRSELNDRPDDWAQFQQEFRDATRETAEIR